MISAVATATPEFDFGKLADRAQEQLDAVEEQRLNVAATALSA